MANVQVRIPDDLLEEIEKIAGSKHTSRSEIVRKLLDEGIEREKFEMAFERYMKGEITLCQAAEIAETSVSRFSKYASDRDIPFMRYTREEAEEDLERLRDHESSS